MAEELRKNGKNFAKSQIVRNIFQLHCEVLVHAWVGVHLWHVLNRFLEHQCMCRHVHYGGIFDISVHICEHTLRRVCTCARVCAVCQVH